MSKQLPVWRMNTGEGVPSDLGREIIYEGHDDAYKHFNFLNGNFYWRINGSADIYAYQTTRTKAAKYRGK